MEFDLTTIDGVLGFCKQQEAQEQENMDKAYRDGKPPRTHKMYMGCRAVYAEIIDRIEQAIGQTTEKESHNEQ